MIHGDLPNFFVKGIRITKAKPFFQKISPQHIMYKWENLNK